MIIDDKSQWKQLLAQINNNDQTLIDMDLSCNALDDEAISELCSALGNNCVTLRLNLRWNQIRIKGAESLKDMLVRNCTLIEVNLSNNKLSDKGIEHICQGLLRNYSLKRLFILSNQLTQNSVKTLLDLLTKNPTLEYIDHQDAEIQDYLCKNRSLEANNNNSNSLTSPTSAQSVDFQQKYEEKDTQKEIEIIQEINNPTIFTPSLEASSLFCQILSERNKNLRSATLYIDTINEQSISCSFDLIMKSKATILTWFQQLNQQQKKDIESQLLEMICYCAKNNKLEMLKALLDLGVVNIDRAVAGRTPLHLAAENDHFECVKILISKNANLFLKTVEELTANDLTKSQLIKELLSGEMSSYMDAHIKKTLHHRKQLITSTSHQDNISEKYYASISHKQ